MNENALAVADALRETLPLQPDTVMVFVTGSQADGTATEASDLDIYHVVRGDRLLQRHYDVIKSAAAGRMKVDVVVDTVERARTNVRLYGYYGYWATHNGILMYENRDSSGWRAVRDAIDGDVWPDCAERWLEFAKQDVDIGESDRDDIHFSCVMYAKSIYASLAAALTHDGVRFGFTRRLADLANLLRDRSVVGGHALTTADRWRRAKVLDKHGGFTISDRDDAENMARSIYRAANNYVNGRRIPQHRPLC